MEPVRTQIRFPPPYRAAYLRVHTIGHSRFKRLTAHEKPRQLQKNMLNDQALGLIY